MTKPFNTILSFLFVLILVLLGSSCKEDPLEARLEEHERMMKMFKDDFNITESDRLQEGLYLKITDDSRVDQSDTLVPDYGSSVVVDLLGYYGENEYIDITDSSDAVLFGKYSNELVYGPIRLDIFNTITGFATAMQHMREGESAIILMAHNLAYGGEIPVLYEVDLHKVIPDAAIYDSIQFDKYKELLNFEDTLHAEEYRAAFYKVTAIGEVLPELEPEDTVTIKLNAYYVETDLKYTDGIPPGRSFFPIGKIQTSTYVFEYGTADFPISNIVHIAVSNMNIGDVWEILSPPDFVYRDKGFRHPRLGNYIVPPNMSVHYRLELVSVTGQDDI